MNERKLSFIVTENNKTYSFYYNRQYEIEWKEDKFEVVDEKKIDFPFYSNNVGIKYKMLEHEGEQYVFNKNVLYKYKNQRLYNIAQSKYHSTQDIQNVNIAVLKEGMYLSNGSILFLYKENKILIKHCFQGYISIFGNKDQLYVLEDRRKLILFPQQKIVAIFNNFWIFINKQGIIVGRDQDSDWIINYRQDLFVSKIQELKINLCPSGWEYEFKELQLVKPYKQIVRLEMDSFLQTISQLNFTQIMIFKQQKNNIIEIAIKYGLLLELYYQVQIIFTDKEFHKFSTQLIDIELINQFCQYDENIEYLAYLLSKHCTMPMLETLYTQYLVKNNIESCIKFFQSQELQYFFAFKPKFFTHDQKLLILQKLQTFQLDLSFVCFYQCIELYELAVRQNNFSLEELFFQPFMHEFKEAIDYLVYNTEWKNNDTSPLILSTQAGSISKMKKYIEFSGYITSDGISALSCVSTKEAMNLLFDKEYHLFKGGTKTSLIQLIRNNLFFKLNKTQQRLIINCQGGLTDNKNKCALCYLLYNKSVTFNENIRLLTEKEIHLISWEQLNYIDNMQFYTEKLKQITLNTIFAYAVQSKLASKTAPKIFGRDVFNRSCYLKEDIFGRSSTEYNYLITTYKKEYQFYQISSLNASLEEEFEDDLLNAIE